MSNFVNERKVELNSYLAVGEESVDQNNNVQEGTLILRNDDRELVIQIDAGPCSQIITYLKEDCSRTQCHIEDSEWAHLLDTPPSYS